jgi:homoserine kinase
MAVLTGLEDLAGHRVAVEVPATSANLGAGYDTLALALEIVDRVTVEVVGAEPGADPGDRAGPVELTVEGDGGGELPADRSNAFVVALERGVAEVRGVPVDACATLGWRVAMQNRIPLSRGLGSSAAATVAGLLSGSALAGSALSIDRLLALASELEGHPDNAAAAVLGGFTIAAHGTAPTAVRFDAPRGLRTVLFIPETRLATRDMRAVLPATVPLRDAVANLQAVGLGVAGLATGRTEFLRFLTVDRLHEPYRATPYPQLPVLVEAARSAGALGACLSGAGSTIIAFVDSLQMIARVEAAFRAAAADLGFAGSTMTVPPRNLGARLLALD